MKNPALEGKRCYLSGPIEFYEGENWRKEPTKILKNEFKIDLFDPFSDPKQQWVEPLKEAQANKDYETMRKIAKSFVRKDLAMVDRADFLIAYLPYKIFTTGTHHEIINSVNAKKPTLLVSNESKNKIPLWYYGIVPHECMFDNWGQLYEYLRQVNDWKHSENNRWHFVYGLV